MTTKINLVLSLTLNVILSLVILENNKKPVSLGDLRDAVADNHVAYQPAPAAPAEVLPPPVTETALADAAPAAAAVEEPTPPHAVIVANDWTAYRQEMADDKDVLVSNLFHSEKTAKIAMSAAVSKLQGAGKDVLFSCLMPATGGGIFYLVRLVPATPEIPRMSPMTSMADVSSRDFVKEMRFITDKTEKELWGSI